MQRPLLSVALAVLLCLSGCNYDTTKDVRPEVESAEPAGDGTYRLDLRVATDDRDTDGAVGPVTVYGYTLSGDLVCTARLPDITESRRTTTTCRSFPSLLVSDTPARGESIEVGNPLQRRQLEIVPRARLYTGRNGSVHQFETLRRGPAEARGFSLQDGRPVPEPALRQRLQCQQWKHERRGADFSALDDPAWLDWERRAPDTTRRYEVRAANVTRLRELNRTTDLGPARDTEPYTGREVPAPLARLVTDNRESGGFSTGVDRDTFYRLLSDLSGRPVNTTAGVPDAMERVRGEAGAYDNTGIDCHATPPRYRENQGGYNYDRGRYVELFVVQDGARWAVGIQTRQEYAGPAFVNVTAPGATPTPGSD